MAKTANESIEMAKQALEKDKQERVEQCSKEINDVLKKYNCTIIPTVSFRPNSGAEFNINIVTNV